MLERLFDRTGSPALEALYAQIDFPAPPDDRPYLFINMVSTADGKIVLGPPGGTARGVGGPTDQILFRRLQLAGDAVLVGAGTIRAGPVIYPARIPRYTLTTAGDLPLSNRFFADAPERAYVIAPASLPPAEAERISTTAQLLTAGATVVDLHAALQIMRRDHGVRWLLCEGGPTLNDLLVREGLADELFLTLAPKLKGGRDTQTTVEGVGWPAWEYTELDLLALYHDGGELYVRYRIGPPHRM